MRVVIIGSGRLGSRLVSIFSKRGDSVLVIEQNESKFMYIEEKQGVELLVGDSNDEKVIRQALKKPADLVIVVTGNDYTNIMISQKIKLIDRTIKVIMRLFDVNLASVYADLGIEVLCPTSLTIDALLKTQGLS
ncbi:MAG: NAD-binding protein [Deltaproteobacteria bacterium]|nr:NAD-binding protein [Deltaproteobacteria bacterium]MCL5277309.1 NAD-binding protein [Deltaproteobacteria bacterium]